MTKKIEIIDVLKGLSILSIVMYHLVIMFFPNAPSYVLKIAGGGATGVHIFVIASGFGLYYSHLKRPLTTVDFIKRRFNKIYIPYIIIVLISYLTPAIIYNGNREGALLSHIFLYKMFSEKYVQSFGGQFWFVSLMFQLYLVYLCIKSFVNSKNIKTIQIASFAISITWWLITKITGLESYRIWNSFMLQYLWEFVLGMCLAEKEIEYPGYIETEYKKVQHSKLCALIALVSLIIFAVLGYTESFFSFLNPVPALIGYTGLLIFAMKIGENNNVLYKLGKAISSFSYELFLVHIYIFIVCKEYINIKPIFVAVIALIVSLCLAKAYNILVKRIYRLLHV